MTSVVKNKQEGGPGPAAGEAPGGLAAGSGGREGAAIVVVGSLALDTVETPHGKAEDVLGGSGSFFALAARLFAPVSLVATIGDDFPPEHLDLLARAGVDLSHVERRAGARTFRWGGRYSADMNTRETLFTHLNVFQEFRPRLDASLKRARYLFLGNIDPELQAEVLRQAKDAGRPELVVADTINFWIDQKREALVRTLAEVDIFILNDEEARKLTGEANLWRAGRQILTMGPAVAVIKKGEHGALLLTREERFSAPSYPLEMVYDPTGAGDSFAGGFMGCLAELGRHDMAALRKAVVYGTVVASFTVERFSVDGLVGLRRDDLERRSQELRVLTGFGA
jgi:sugar/nucleoside kinase (ribokinase family)